ncbi:helix-turn-helix transcriptional regulator [Kordiimonas sp.]|uniref:helix-turn-helix transcriptional regulator n=1 Tax=Kordiimonas sp. TaxID=1970157 RepID=UPI003A9341C7
MDNVSNLIGQMETAIASHDVWQHFLDFIEARGFKCATYGYSYAPINTPVEEENGKDTHVRVSLAGRTWITSMPKEGVEEYQSRHYEKVDPMIHQIEKRSMQPLYMARELLDPTDPNFKGFDFILQRAEHYGIFSAVGFPVRHAFGRGHGEVTLHAVHPVRKLREIMKMHGDEVHLAAIYMHTFYQPLERKERAAQLGIKGRPHQVLQQLNAGLTNGQIAARLGVSAPTVSFHIKELKAALAVTSTREILPSAMRLGILED